MPEVSMTLQQSDPASFAGYEGAWGYWTILPMLDAKEIRAPWGAEFHRREKPAMTGLRESGQRESTGTVDHILSPGESPGER